MGAFIPSTSRGDPCTAAATAQLDLESPDLSTRSSFSEVKARSQQLAPLASWTCILTDTGVGDVVSGHSLCMLSSCDWVTAIAGEFPRPDVYFRGHGLWRAGSECSSRLVATLRLQFLLELEQAAQPVPAATPPLPSVPAPHPTSLLCQVDCKQGSWHAPTLKVSHAQAEQIL